MKKKVVLIFLVIVMIASFAGTAFAEPPEHLRWEQPLYDVVDCGNFDLILDTNTRISVTYFSDENNNPAAVEYQYKWNGTMTNTGTGSVFVDSAVINGRRLWTGNRDNHGIYYHYNVPGAGVVTLAVGRIVWDENGEVSFISGQGFYDMFVDPGEYVMLCESLGGQ